MTSYRVILIDPTMRTVSEQQWDGKLDSLAALIGAHGMDHTMFAKYDDGGIETGWLADDGLIKGDPVHAFLLPISKDPMAGRCAIIGEDARGVTTSSRFPVDVVRRDVEWLGLIKPEVTWDSTDTGMRAIVTYSRVKPKM